MAKTEQNALDKELEALKAIHSKVRSFIIPLDEDDDDKKLTLFLKPCDRKTEDMINKQAKGSRERAVIMGLKALQLGGENVDTLNGNDFAMRAAEAGLVDFMAPARVEIKKN